MGYAVTITLIFLFPLPWFDIFCFVAHWPFFTLFSHDSCLVEGLRFENHVSKNSFYNRCPFYCLGLREKEETPDDEETLGINMLGV